METPKIFEKEYKFCLILWEHEPIRSGELAKLCEEQLGWKTTTTYTVIKRLSDRGVLKNENLVVTSLVSREEVQASEIDEFVEEKFAGSIPAFFAASRTVVPAGTSTLTPSIVSLTRLSICVVPPHTVIP